MLDNDIKKKSQIKQKGRVRHFNPDPFKHFTSRSSSCRLRSQKSWNVTFEGDGRKFKMQFVSRRRCVNKSVLLKQLPYCCWVNVMINTSATTLWPQTDIFLSHSTEAEKQARMRMWDFDKKQTSICRGQYRSTELQGRRPGDLDPCGLWFNPTEELLELKLLKNWFWWGGVLVFGAVKLQISLQTHLRDNLKMDTLDDFKPDLGPVFPQGAWPESWLIICSNNPLMSVESLT